MNTHTKRRAIIAAVCFALAVVVVGLFVREINHQSIQLSEQIIAIQTDRAQQAVFTRVKRVSSDTASIREQLQGYFLQSQSDSIDFLNFIEAQAAVTGVELTTNAPKEIVENGITYLSVSYVIIGSLSRVENFVQQLEQLPYVSELDSLVMTEQSGNVWKADVTVVVDVLSYEN